MSRIVGIDLGTTNSLVAAVDGGIPYVIADPQGARLTPSIVHFPLDRSECVVGEPARRARAAQPERTVFSIKRYMGRNWAGLPPEEQSAPYPLAVDPDGRACVQMDGRTWLPEAISSQVLARLRAIAEGTLDESVTRAVITVPAYFSHAQREATKRAGELAGLTVERIVNEPTAAALAYGLDRLEEHAKVAVYDLGGGTFDLSILELKGGVFEVLSTSGNTRLGGDDIDRALVRHLLSQPGMRDMQGNAVAMARLREAAEAAKVRLSTDGDVELSLPFLRPDFHFHHTLTRVELDHLAQSVVQQTREHCLRAMADAGLKPLDLDRVILVGGQTRMPLVRRMVAEWFECSEFDEEREDIRLGSTHHKRLGPVLDVSQNPDEAVALGAAIQAEILSGGFRNVLLLDVTPLSLGIETFGGLMNVIIPRNSTIPVKAGEMFTNAVDNQSSVMIHVLQGERERASDNWSLGKFTLSFDRVPRGVARVGVQFEIDANGILHVLARNVRTGQQRVVDMTSAINVDDAAVQKMVEESVEHAFEDLRLRQWVEARLRATQVTDATRKGLDLCGNDVPEAMRREIMLALDGVQSLLDAADVAGQPGDAGQLKQGLARLDSVTESLADLMMERVMERSLQKRGLA